MMGSKKTICEKEPDSAHHDFPYTFRYYMHICKRGNLKYAAIRAGAALHGVKDIVESALYTWLELDE